MFGKTGRHISIRTAEHGSGLVCLGFLDSDRRRRSMLRRGSGMQWGNRAMGRGSGRRGAVGQALWWFLDVLALVRKRTRREPSTKRARGPVVRYGAFGSGEALMQGIPVSSLSRSQAIGKRYWQRSERMNRLDRTIGMGSPRHFSSLLYCTYDCSNRLVGIWNHSAPTRCCWARKPKKERENSIQARHKAGNGRRRVQGLDSMGRRSVQEAFWGTV